MYRLDVADNIWVFGYNNMGRNAYNLLKQIYGAKVCGILESKKTHIDTIDYNEVDIRENDIVFICTNPKFHRQIMGKINNGIIYTKNIDELLCDKVKNIPLLESRFLALSVGQACSLKCKKCANFSPFSKKQNLKYKIENIKYDIKNVLSYFKIIDTLHIQGGEPFLHTELIDVLKYLMQYRSIFKKVQIATNGTIIPSSKVLDVISINRDIVEIRISKYPHVDVENLISILEERNIIYRMYDFAKKNGKWIDTGDINYIDEFDGFEYLAKKVYDCPWCCCYTVENGLVGRCARSVPAMSLQKIPFCEEDYLILIKSSDLDYRKYFMFINPMTCCKRCKGGYGNEIEPALQI